MSLDSLNLQPLEDVLATPEVQERLLAKIRVELQGIFLSEAARCTAWPHSAIPSETAVSSAWLPPGAYSFGELENRLAPRLMSTYNVPDPRYRVCETAVESSVLSLIKTLLLLEEQDALRAQAAAQNVSDDELVNVCLELVGTPVIEQLVAAVRDMTAELTAEGLKDTARRHALSEAAELAEQHHMKRCLMANQARYEKLRLQWLKVAGDRGTSRLNLKSPLLPTFYEWLQTLAIEDAAIFLYMHDMSKGVSAGKGLPQAFVEKLANVTMPDVPVEPSPIYGRLRTFLDEMLSISGLRMLTITTSTSEFIRFDIDRYNRVGNDERHLGVLLDSLYNGFVTQAGVMVRAIQGPTVSVYQAEKATFATVPAKHLYGALLRNRRATGMNARQVEYAHTHDMVTGKPVTRQASVIPQNWPKRDAIISQAAPKATPPLQLPAPRVPPKPPEPPVGA